MVATELVGEADGTGAGSAHARLFTSPAAPRTAGAAARPCLRLAPWAHYSLVGVACSCWSTLPVTLNEPPTGQGACVASWPAARPSLSLC